MFRGGAPRRLSENPPRRFREGYENAPRMQMIWKRARWNANSFKECGVLFWCVLPWLCSCVFFARRMLREWYENVPSVPRGCFRKSPRKPPRVPREYSEKAAPNVLREDSESAPNIFRESCKAPRVPRECTEKAPKRLRKCSENVPRMSRKC